MRHTSLAPLILSHLPSPPPPPFSHSLDTFKTHLQFNTGRTHLSFAGWMRREGFVRLWRGAPALVVACVPSHAAYFSAYEAGKQALGANEPGHHPIAAAGSGALATLLHDAVLTPMDVVKQRLQLGYYNGLSHCLRTMLREEGVRVFFASYPTTVLMNIPYAATVVAANESLKKWLVREGAAPGLITFLLAGAGAGAVGAAVTCPLDVVKTRLQTASLRDGSAGGSGGGGGGGAAAAEGGYPAGTSSSASPRRVQRAVGALPSLRPQAALLYTSAATPGAMDVARAMLREEGASSFFRGLGARVLTHMPAMAISWATYETVKSALTRIGGERV